MTPTPDRYPQRTIPSGPTRQELRAHPAVRNYTLLCLAGLLLIVVCLADRGLGWWSLLPALIGGVALLALWSIGPPLVLLSLTGLILAITRSNWRYSYWTREEVPTLMDLILCAATLAYVLSHYRLLSLLGRVFPENADRKGTPHEQADPSRRRSADLVSAWEKAALLLALPLWTSLSVVVWGWMIEEAMPLDMPRSAWRTLRLVWAALTIGAATGVVAGYLRQTLATPEESLLYLQDQLWRQTRHEQGSLNRWLAWARLRARRGKEGL
jgi:hypothetical protein